MSYAQKINQHTKITSQMFVSNWGGSKDVKQLTDHKIKTIICLNEERTKSTFDMKLYEDLKIEHHYIKAADHRTTRLNLTELIELIEKSLKNGAVLVHCSAGSSRSPTVVLAYLLKITYESPETPFDVHKKILPVVMEYVRKRRDIDPNIGFLKQLRDFETKLRSS